MDRWAGGEAYSAILQGSAQMRYATTVRQSLSKGLPGEVMPTRRRFIAGTTGALVAAAMRNAQAQANYPDRPIRIIAGYPAGGGIDLVARLIGDPMKAALGQRSWRTGPVPPR
jgi:hypothetical protein